MKGELMERLKQDREGRMVKLLYIIRAESLNAEGLSERVGVNATNVKRMIRDLRGRGHNIVTVHTLERFYYELRD